MKSLSALLAAALLALGLCAQDTFEPPVIKTKVLPENPGDPKTSSIEPTRVELTIDAKGQPFSLKSDSGLPDNVVEALSKWQFVPAHKGKDAVASVMNLVVPVQRPLDPARGTGRHSPFSKETQDAIQAVKQFDPSDAAHLEQVVQSGSGSRNDHLTLLAYARTNPGPETNRLILRQIQWLVNDDPKAPLLGSAFALPDPASSSGSEEYQQLRQTWLSKLKDNPKDPLILDHATNFLRFSDPDIVESYAQASLADVSGAALFLGDDYALAALGVTALDSQNGQPSMSAPQLPATPFAEKALSSLMSTADPRILFSALSSLRSAGFWLAKAGHLPDRYPALCAQLLTRSKMFDPSLDLPCDPKPQTLGLLRVGGPVIASKIIKQAKPIYPPDARSRRITGTVHFETIIGKDGHIRRLELISGPFALYQSARDAVIQWQYTPTKLNNSPAEVLTVIDVNYALN